jgi:hypothetical protein
MFGIKTKKEKLCIIVSKELEKQGYCAWPIKKSPNNYNLGVTLPDNVCESQEETMKFRNVINELNEKYFFKLSIDATNPVFSAGGVYASYLSVKRAKLIQIL